MKNKTKITIVDIFHDMGIPLIMVVIGILIAEPSTNAFGGFLVGMGIILFSDTNRWWKK